MATPKGIEKFVKTTAITDMAALAKGSMTSWRYGNGMKEKGKPSISIEPWDAGQLGSKKWDSNKYLERLEELSEMGVTHIPVMLSSIGRRYEATRSEFLETVNEYAQLIGINEVNL